MAEVTHSRRIIFWITAAAILPLIYLFVSWRLTPSWVVGEEVAQTDKYIEIGDQNLASYPNLEKFIKNMSRSSEEPKQGVQVLIRGSNGQGKRLKSFLENTRTGQNSAYPYIIKHGDKYYGLDILFQFRSPWVY